MCSRYIVSSCLHVHNTIIYYIYIFHVTASGVAVWKSITFLLTEYKLPIYNIHYPVYRLLASPYKRLERISDSY